MGDFDTFALDRADALIAEVRKAEADYTNTQPYTIDMGMKLAPHVSKVRVFIDKPLPLDPVRALVGDSIHNLRSTLDHLATALVESHTPAPSRPDKVQFPIFEDETKFDKQAKGVQEASPAAQAAVRALQPFATPAQTHHPLSQLQRLSNFSKHRKPLAAAAFATANGIGLVRWRNADLIVLDSVHVGPFASGDVLATYLIRASAPDFDMELEPLFSVVWSFGKDSPLPGLPLVATLEEISSHLRGVVLPALEAFIS